MRLKEVGARSEEIIKGLSVLKQIDELNKDVIDEQRNYLKNVKYVEREEDLELKKLYEEE